MVSDPTLAILLASAIASKAPHLKDRQGVLKEGGQADLDAGVRRRPLESDIKSLNRLSKLRGHGATLLAP